MTKSGLIFLLIGFCVITQAQVAFKTIVTNGPVMVGQSFQVQYVLEDIDKNDEFYPPEFKNLRLAGGPYVYEGTAYGTDGSKKIKNIVYTLEALKIGRIIIPGASAKINDHFIKSDDVPLEVIANTEAMKRTQALQESEANSAYFLKPGEDPYKKIRDNLFLKVMVDRKSCFVGEPVTATFKLYSRMISKSDIVKNPGFYGFTVMDVIGLNDKLADVETIDGKKFDVHTVRKVQLYPLQAGSFAIDPMEVTNQVEFSRSAVYKKAEQEITEGVYPHGDPAETVNTETYENKISSEPVKITVKPSPEKNQPADYTGATGHFAITASVNQRELGKNEEGHLTIIVSGKGNFTQLSAPVIHWPDSLEGFDPRVTDSLDKNHSPLKGTRVFYYSIVSAKAGEYVIPAIHFSFFDPDSATYKTVSTQPIVITVSNEEKARDKIAPETGAVKHSYRIISWLLMMVALAGIGSLFIWFRRKQQSKKEKTVTEEKNTLPSVASLMKPAQEVVKEEDKIFYAACQQCAWKFFTIYFGLSGSKMSNRQLETAMLQKGVDEKSQKEVLALLQECETGIFAGAVLQTDKHAFFGQMTASLEQVSRYV